jgi:hypothetical protein
MPVRRDSAGFSALLRDYQSTHRVAITPFTATINLDATMRAQVRERTMAHA